MSERTIVINLKIDDEKVKKWEKSQDMKMPKIALPSKLIMGRIKKEITKFNLSDDILVDMPYEGDAVDDWVKMLKIDINMIKKRENIR